MSKLHDKHEGTVIKRASKRAHDDEHGGAWKVAFADFCLALLCLFLVLWLLASREQQAMQNIIKESSAGMLQGAGAKPEIAGGPKGSLIERFAMPHNGTGPGKDQGAASAPTVQYDSASELAALAKELADISAEAGLSSNLAAVVTPHGLRVMLHDTDKIGMFLRGSPLPSPRFAGLMRKIGPLFARMENQMLVVGHTDAAQYASAGHAGYSNWTLSVNRALAARAELLAGGMRKDSVLQVVGMADRAPLDPANATAGVNRRIELLILTRAQAASVAAMFGVPGSTHALTPDASAALPDDATLKQLRSQLAN